MGETTEQEIARDQMNQEESFSLWGGWTIVGALACILFVKAIREGRSHG